MIGRLRSFWDGHGFFFQAKKEGIMQPTIDLSTALIRHFLGGDIVTLGVGPRQIPCLHMYSPYQYLGNGDTIQ